MCCDRISRVSVGRPFIWLAGLLGAVMLFWGVSTVRSAPAAGAPTEYDIKAAFLYRFLFFIKWPHIDTDNDDADIDADIDAANQESPIVIGIVGRDPFGHAFADIEGKPNGPENRLVRIHRFGPYQPSLDLGDCDLLFISRTAREHVPAILEQVAGQPVLLAGDHPGFVEAGGMINLVLQDRLVRWEINRTAMTKVGLRPQAQLLRNAIRILDVEEDSP